MRQLIIECERIAYALEEDISALSSLEQKKQEELREEVAELCKNLDPNIEENLNESLIELDSGHFLGSAMITSRVIDYVLSQLKIRDKEEIKDLIKSTNDKIDKKTLKEQTEKISRLSRNLYTHRIDRFASKFSQAQSLLSDCLFLLEMLKQYESKE